MVLSNPWRRIACLGPPVSVSTLVTVMQAGKGLHAAIISDLFVKSNIYHQVRTELVTGFLESFQIDFVAFSAVKLF